VFGSAERLATQLSLFTAKYNSVTSTAASYVYLSTEQVFMKKFLIENVCNMVVVEGLARSEGDFCVKWLDRGEGYMRTLRCQRLRPSADALAICADKLERYAKVFEHSNGMFDADKAKTLRVLKQMCETAIAEGAAAKWHGYNIY
jgi:hypothetical protein